MYEYYKFLRFQLSCYLTAILNFTTIYDKGKVTRGQPTYQRYHLGLTLLVRCTLVSNF
jgi:hypothetical protein